MTDGSPPDFSAVIGRYAELEPAGTDTWNPLRSDRELLHRLTLYERLCLALRRTSEPTSLRVLDVGCGTGRSTRVYLDFGIAPEQLTGIDLRPAAVETARRAHPGIDVKVYDGTTIPLESESVDWVSLCTVISSIPGEGPRRHLAREIRRVLAPGGHVFYWDRGEAKDFAGGDVLDPVELFSDLTVVSQEQVRIEGRPERLFESGLSRRVVLPLARPFFTPRTHRVCLFRKGES